MQAADSADRTGFHTLMTDRLGWLSVRSVQILAVIALVAVVVLGLVQLKLVVIPAMIALILAAALNPVMRWLRRHGASSMLATWITLFSGAVVFGGIIALIVFAVENQWQSLVDAATDGVGELQAYLAQLSIPIDPSQFDSVRTSVMDFVTSSQFGSGAIAGVSAATQVVTGFVLGLVILFFFLKDGDRIWAFFLRTFDGVRLERGHRIGHTSVRVLGGYVRGTALVALADAVGIGVGLLILQVPLALPLSIMVFLGGFIPLIGATLAGVLAVLVALVTNGPVAALIVIAVVVAVNQLEGNFLQPVVMAQSLKLHPLVILLALTAGTILGGIIGAVLAVPITAVSWAIAKVWKEPGTAADSDGATEPAESA